jgi:hypothetical protein
MLSITSYFFQDPCHSGRIVADNLRD